MSNDSEITRLQHQITILEKQLAQRSNVKQILSQGFETLSAQLGPLQNLAPERTLLGDDRNARLQNLRKALARPEWNGAGTLPMEEYPVFFIGEVAPQQVDSIQGTLTKGSTSP